MEARTGNGKVATENTNNKAIAERKNMKYGIRQAMATNWSERVGENGGDVPGESYSGVKRSFSGMLAAAAVCVFLFAGAAHATCAYCGQNGIGTCGMAPDKVHKHTDWGPDKCMYCGSTAYGACIIAPHGKHERGYGGNGCRFCGSPSIGSCIFSPSKRHER